MANLSLFLTFSIFWVLLSLTPTALSEITRHNDDQQTMCVECEKPKPPPLPPPPPPPLPPPPPPPRVPVIECPPPPIVIPIPPGPPRPERPPLPPWPGPPRPVRPPLPPWPPSPVRPPLPSIPPPQGPSIYPPDAGEAEEEEEDYGDDYGNSGKLEPAIMRLFTKRSCDSIYLRLVQYLIFVGVVWLPYYLFV